MCKLGDIIVVENYIGEDGKKIGRHSFVVIDDNKGCISGLDYDLVMTVISSFKSEKHKKKKLSYKENIELDRNIKLNNGKVFEKESYIKADKLYYFNKKKLNYYLLGKITKDMQDKLIKLIISLILENKTIEITNNL